MVTVDIVPIKSLSNLTPMSLEEAEAGWARVNMAAEFTESQLLELYRRQAWKAYLSEDGKPLYSGWQECAMAKIKRGRSTIAYKLKIAEIQERLLTSGIDQSTIVDCPVEDSHYRLIQQAPEAQQPEVFLTLVRWSRKGEITAKDAEAAVWLVDDTKRYNKAEKLVCDYIVAKRDTNVSTSKPILEWAQEKKGYTPRQLEILKEDVEAFLDDDHSSASVPAATPPKPDKSLKIASFLNGHEPEDVAQAVVRKMGKECLRAILKAAEEEDKVSLLAEILSGLDSKEAVAILQKNKVSEEDGKALANKAYNFCQALDEVF